MDRKSPHCMAQIILEMGQDSSWQHLFQNTLHPAVRSHQKPILSNSNTSNPLTNPLRGIFLVLSKQRILRRRCHRQLVPRMAHRFSSPGTHVRAGEPMWEPSFGEALGHQPHFVTRTDQTDSDEA